MNDYKKRPVKMSLRLHMVADLISEGKIVADIGTDHGYIPIYQVLTGKSPYAYACDVAKGPLGRAENNIKLYGVSDKVGICLSDGLKELAKCVDNIPRVGVIAGMGGSLICKILREGKEVTDKLDELILSPHSEIAEVRQFLYDNDFSIIEENMVYDEGKFYVAMKVVHKKGNISGLEMTYGPVLIRKKHPVLAEYLRKEIDTCDKILDNLKINGSENSKDRVDMINARKNEMIKMLDIMK